VKADQFFPGSFIAAEASRYEALVLTQATFYQIAVAAKTRRLARNFADGDRGADWLPG
jgi:hypothetical protein